MGSWCSWGCKKKVKHYKQKTQLQGYKTQIKILAYPGLAYSSFEEPYPGAPLLGLAKSIYYENSYMLIINIIIIIIITKEMNKIVVCSAISPTHVSSVCFSMILMLRVQGHKVE